MRISDYRKLLDTLAYLQVSLVRAATSFDKRVVCMQMRQAVRQLQKAKPRNAKLADLERAARVLGSVLPTLVDHEKRFAEADAALSRLAYGGEWK